MTIPMSSNPAATGAHAIELLDVGKRRFHRCPMRRDQTPVARYLGNDRH